MRQAPLQQSWSPPRGGVFPPSTVAKALPAMTRASQDIRSRRRSRRSGTPIGSEQRPVPPARCPTRSRSRSSIRRPTSPARCTSATRSTTRCRTCVVRYERLRGKEALWVVGMDHAGIATQMVVERQIERTQDKRTNYTAARSSSRRSGSGRPSRGGPIFHQLRRLGCLDGLEPRAVHDGPALLSRGRHQGVRRALHAEA